jgi:hypothetical protein
MIWDRTGPVHTFRLDRNRDGKPEFIVEGDDSVPSAICRRTSGPAMGVARTAGAVRRRISAVSSSVLAWLAARRAASVRQWIDTL